MGNIPKECWAFIRLILSGFSSSLQRQKMFYFERIDRNSHYITPWLHAGPLSVAAWKAFCHTPFCQLKAWQTSGSLMSRPHVLMSSCPELTLSCPHVQSSRPHVQSSCPHVQTSCLYVQSSGPEAEVGVSFFVKGGAGPKTHSGYTVAEKQEPFEWP